MAALPAFESDASRYPPANDDVAEFSAPIPRGATFTAADLERMRFAPVRYVVPGYVADGLTILAGRPKLGKSWLVLDICAAVASGGETLGGVECVGGDVLYCALEDNPRRLQTRLRKVLGSDWPPRLSFKVDLRRIDDGGLDDLREWLETHPEARMIAIDTLMPIRPTKRGNEDPYMYDARSIRPIKDLADEFSVAIVVVTHTRKAETTDPLEAVSGTNGLNGAADATLVLDRGQDGCTLYGRGRDIEEIETALDFDKETCRWLARGEPSEFRRSDTRNKIIAALREAGEPIGPNVIADVTGLEVGNVRQRLLKMVRSGEVTKTGRGKYRG